MAKTVSKSAPRLTAAAPLAIALAMLTIYIVWGTTYLAIRVVVDPDQGVAIPPFAMVAIRFAFAGLAMLALVALFARDALRSLTRAQIRDQAIVGLALNVGGLGVTSFGEQTIPSG
ncbi:MAG: EamA family transporter, partial [Chloroflexi bacterium]